MRVRKVGSSSYTLVTGALGIALATTMAVVAAPTPAGGQPVGNSVSVSSAVASVGEVVVVSGHDAVSCTGGSALSFLTASGTAPVPGFLPPGAYPVQVLTPPAAAGASWTVDFAIPAYLAASRQSGVAVTPGAYTLTNSCDGAPPASVTLTVTGAYPPTRFVAVAATPDGGGYWLAQAGGGVYAYGDAGFYGSLPGLGIDPTTPIVGMAATADGRGYWLVGADGGVYAFGDASYAGSLPALGVIPAGPVVGIAATADGRGYWLLGADGGVFAFGDASFFGEAAGQGYTDEPFSAITAVPGSVGTAGYVVTSEYDDAVVAFAPSGGQVVRGPNLGPGAEAPFVGVAPAASGTPSVWTVETDGGVFTYAGGSSVAGFYGSLPSVNVTPAAAVTAIASTPDHHGYWLLGGDGGVFAFGDADFYGSAIESAANLPPCTGQQFDAAVTTSAASYTPGQPVTITLSLVNDGATCWSEPNSPGGSNADVLDGCPYVTASTAGQLVWNSAALPNADVTCPAIGRSGPVPTGWSHLWPFTWDQDECPTSGSPCTQAQLAAGDYTIAFGKPTMLTGNWDGITVIPAVVTLTTRAAGT